MELYLFILCLASIALCGFQYYMHQKEKKGLYDRFMSKDFGEYQYFEKQYPKEIKKQERKEKKEEKKKLSPREALAKKQAEKF